MPTEEPNKSEGAPTPEALTPERGSNILFHSFRASQGNILAQRILFDLIHHKHQDWVMNDDLYSEVLNLTKSRLGTYMFPTEQVRQHHVPELIIQPAQRNITPSKATDMLTSMADTMKQSFTQSDREAKRIAANLDLIRRMLLQSMVISDVRFLTTNGRPRTQESVRWSSYFREYIMERRAFGVLEIDEVLEDLRSIWSTQGATITFPNNKAEELLATLSNAWELHHPGKDFYSTNLKAVPFEARI